MRLSLTTFPLLFLSALPATADWERLRPETAAPPVIAPAPDAVCREKARSIDVRRAAAADETGGRGAALRIREETEADWRWFFRRCFRPRVCPAAKAPGPPLREPTVTGAYERLLRLCNRPDGQR